MKYVCGECGYEAAESGDCPECGVPLLSRQDEILEMGAEADDSETPGDEDDDLEELS